MKGTMPKSEQKNPFFSCLGHAFLLNLVLEILGNRSVFLALEHLVMRPASFLYNTCIILLTLAVALLFRKRKSVEMVIGMVWLGLGIANFCLMQYRDAPLSADDFYINQDTLDLLGLYLTPVQTILLCVLVVGVVAGIVVAFMKEQKTGPQYKKIVPALILTAGAVFMPINTVIKAEDLVSKYATITDTYANYGFACCFSYSIFNSGIDKPDDYSRQEVAAIVETLQADETKEPKTKPNIVIVQLESFVDPERIKDVTYSEDPISNFRELAKNHSTGFLRVPVVGGGTANTEFEVLCQMSTEFFGVGESPFKTVVSNQPCENIGFYLKEQGYKTHAIHNHTATFYDRNTVYANLGFDTFTSSEYMGDAERNPLGWIRDAELLDVIEKAMQSTKERDFVYTVSVQCHGRYPEEPMYEEAAIEVYGVEDEGRRNEYTFYVNQEAEVDAFVGALVERLSENPEPTVLVLYGDHFPCLDLEDEDLESGDIYQTEYVIWSNFDLPKVDRDLEAYQLSAEVLTRLGMGNGLLSRLHQTQRTTPDYKETLKTVQYDLLFGRQYSKMGAEPLEPTEIHMGIDEISITGVKVDAACVYVTGTGFTPYSRVKIGNRLCETRFVSGSMLVVDAEVEEPLGDVVVEQVSENKTVLSQTKPYRKLKP